MFMNVPPGAEWHQIMWKIGVIKSGSRLCCPPVATEHFWVFFLMNVALPLRHYLRLPDLFYITATGVYSKRAEFSISCVPFESHILGGLWVGRFLFFLSFLFTHIHHSSLEGKLNIMGRLQPADEDGRDIDGQSCFLHGFEVQFLYYGATHRVTQRYSKIPSKIVKELCEYVLRAGGILRLNTPVNSTHVNKYRHPYFTTLEMGCMELSQRILKHLSNNIPKKNDLSYHQRRTGDEKWLLARISSILISSFWIFFPFSWNSERPPLGLRQSLRESSKAAEQRGSLIFLCQAPSGQIRGPFWRGTLAGAAIHEEQGDLSFQDA